MKFPEQFRMKNAPHGYQTKAGDTFGMFSLTGVGGRKLVVIACDGNDTGWEHVSVSIYGTKKTPIWDEMCLVKRLFWDDQECVVQFHPPEDDYVNNHPGVLHLWKSVNELFPMPPKICV